MKTLLYSGALFFIGMWCYAIYIALYIAQKRSELTMTWFIVGFIPLVIGYVIDVLMFNWIIATVVLREWPQERTFSARLNRWWRHYTPSELLSSSDYRLRYVNWWARQLNSLTPPHLEHIHRHDRPRAV